VEKEGDVMDDSVGYGGYDIGMLITDISHYLIPKISVGDY
jgi:hypothetical protein